MKKTLFIVSDIHSFYTPFKKALDEKGFDANSENHWLIVCGDAFDRGTESKEVLNFLLSLERKILVKGNHDLLLQELISRGYPQYHDSRNGTKQTVLDLGKEKTEANYRIQEHKELENIIKVYDVLLKGKVKNNILSSKDGCLAKSCFINALKLERSFYKLHVEALYSTYLNRLSTYFNVLTQFIDEENGF